MLNTELIFNHKPSLDSKKLFGEVITPIELINEMLDILPIEVWSNPKLKWLDPAAGVGNFHSMIINRLMNGLKDLIEDEELRYKHIIENMLYFVELQSKNAYIIESAFDVYDKYKTNIYCGSFLDEKFDNHCNRIWGINKFDIIIGNPPYQELKEGNRKSQPLWHLFVDKSIDLLTDNGYLCMVHPNGWRNVDGVFKEIQRKILSYDILELRMHDVLIGLKIFNAKTTFDFYCLRKSFNKIETRIKTYIGNEMTEIFNLEFIPNGYSNEIKSLLSIKKEDRINILYSYSAYEPRKQHMTKIKTEEFKYPCVYTIVKNGNINFLYSSVDKGHFGIPKIIWSNGYSTKTVIDKLGEYGLTPFSYAIVDTIENLEKIEIAMNSEKFLKLMRPLEDGHSHKYDKNIISLFKKDFWKEFI